MRLRTNIDLWGSALFTALGLIPLACGGSTVDNSGAAGNGTAGSLGHDGGGGAGGAGGGAGAGVGGKGVAGMGIGGSGPGGAGGSGAIGGSGGDSNTAGIGGAGGFGGDVAPPRNPFPCLNPTPVVVSPPVMDAGATDVDSGTSGATGYVQCSGGFTHRPVKQTCPSALPRDMTFMPLDAGFGTQCAHDTDCAAMPNGYCATGGQIPGTYCIYGCTTDEQCPSNSICMCGEPVGQCVPASCTTDSDCGGTLLCTSYMTNPGCPGQSFACQTPGDTCGGDQDCANLPNGACWLNGGTTRACENNVRCVVGRPFLVHGEERLADVRERADWHGPAALSCAGLKTAERKLLAEEWTKVALMEHASIAAFARFGMQLLQLGAPAELVEAAAAAMADETKHARLCFAVASGYAGRAVGPGSLRIAGSLDESSLASALVTTIREGCIGETIAAIEAAEMCAHATDPWVRDVLDTIRQDETRHAELAWRFVRWALAEGGEELRVIAARTFASAESDPIDGLYACVEEDANSVLLAGGIAPASLRRRIRLEALARVIRPCAETMLATPGYAASSDLLPNAAA